MPRKPVKPTAASTVDRPKRVIPKKNESPAVASSPKKAPVEKAAPKEKDAAAPAKSSHRKTKRGDKPTYERMVMKALRDLGGRNFHSAQAVGKYVEANYPVPFATYKRSIRQALKKASEDGNVIQQKNSFRLSPRGTVLVGKKKASTATKRKATSDGGRPAKRTTRTSKKAGSIEEPRSKKAKKAPIVEEESEEEEEVAPKRRAAAKKAEPKKATAPKRAAPKKRATPKKRSTKTDKSEASSDESDAAATSENAPSTKKPEGLKGDHLWQYQDGHWKNYDVEASNTVEEVYQGYLANRGDTDVRAVHSGQWEYMVDFMAMKQTNIQHENHTVRNIRRVPVS